MTTNDDLREAIRVSNQQTAILPFLVYAFLQVYVSCTTNIAVAEEETMTLSITSAAFEEGGSMPAVYTCEGDDISPPHKLARPWLHSYEGISGYEEYRDDLVLMYLVTMQPRSGKLVRFEMVPFQIKRFRLNYVSSGDAQWLKRTMNRECARFGGHVERSETDRWTLDTVDSAAVTARTGNPD